MRTVRHDNRSGGRGEARYRIRRVRANTRRLLGGRPKPAPVAATIFACVAIFGVALGARLLLHADQRTSVEAAHEITYSQPRHYQNAGRRILDDPVHALLFDESNDRGRERLLGHPPGYPIFIAAVFGAFGDSSAVLRGVQLVLDSFSVVLLFLIAARMFRTSIAVSSGLIAALSPQLAWNALVLQPDTVAIVPLLAAVLVLVWKPRPALRAAIAAGALVGISCWLRSNAFLLAPFLAVVAVPMLFPGGQRRRAACALVLATVAVIAPVTLRNWYIFDRFIPLSLGAGITFAEGIGDFDPDSRFGIPSTDVEMAMADAEWAGRPEYAKAVWFPDAIERDRERFRRAAMVVIRNPVWFSSVMVRRAGLMFRCNDELRLGWPADTTHAPMVCLNPPYGHDRTLPASDSSRVLSTLDSIPVKLANNESLPLWSIAVNPGTDYLVRAPVDEVVGFGALDVRDENGALVASSPVREHGNANKRRRQKPGRDQRQAQSEIVLPIASVDARRLDFSFRAEDGALNRGLTLRMGQIETLEVGPTPSQWTRAPRWMIRSIQRNIFQTSRWPVMVLAGAAIFLLGYRRRGFVAVVAVPAYYMLVQSALHTEFRYVLAVHALSSILVALALVGIVAATVAAFRTIHRRLRARQLTRPVAEVA